MSTEKENTLETSSASGEDSACDSGSCATGGCGGPGLCPGVALLLAYVFGGGIALLTGMNWLGWAVGIPVALILITGAWRFLPQSSTDQAQ